MTCELHVTKKKAKNITDFSARGTFPDLQLEGVLIELGREWEL